MYRNREAGKNWRFWGDAKLLRDGEVREGIMGRTYQPELDAIRSARAWPC